jgi:F-type H+-transporting ATPase subunit alpha
MPAVNPGISVSRVGGSAQIKAMKKVSGKLKLMYSQYRELASFAQFGSDLDDDTKARLAQGERIVEILKQGRNKPVQVELQVVIIYACVNDYLKDIPVQRVSEFETFLFENIQNNFMQIIDSISKTKDLTEETEKLIITAIEDSKSKFFN